MTSARYPPRPTPKVDLSQTALAAPGSVGPRRVFDSTKDVDELSDLVGLQHLEDHAVDDPGQVDQECFGYLAPFRGEAHLVGAPVVGVVLAQHQPSSLGPINPAGNVAGTLE